MAPTLRDWSAAHLRNGMFKMNIFHVAFPLKAYDWIQVTSFLLLCVDFTQIINKPNCE